MRPVTVIAMLAAAALSGCGTQDGEATGGAMTIVSDTSSLAEPTVLYWHDFSEGSGGWLTTALDVGAGQTPAEALACWNEGAARNCYVPVSTADGQMTLKSPWYHDPNHAPPGAGYLALLTWVYLNGFAGAGTAHLPEIDLRELTLYVSMKSEGLDVKVGELYFWFQMLAPDGRYVNYAYTGKAINVQLRDGEFREVRLPLHADPASWTCLGSSAVRTDWYGCLPLDEAMSHVNGDFGFIILPVDALPIAEVQPSGSIEVQWIEIVGGESFGPRRDRRSQRP